MTSASSSRSVLDELLDQQAEIARLKRILRSLEWMGDTPRNERGVKSHGVMCVLCDQVREHGHAPDCPLGQALE